MVHYSEVGSPEYPGPKVPLKMGDIAKDCDIHVTTVARAVDDKICQIDTGSIRCREFFFGSRSK